MASDDVIELGSSDEDTEPAPKKRKPPPMVHIPNRLQGITIKPSKSNTKINPACIIKGSIGKSVTVTKIPKNNVNPYANKPKGKLMKVYPVKRNLRIPIQKSAVSPHNNAGSVPLLNLPVVYKTGLNPLSKPGIKTNVRAMPINMPGVSPVNIVKLQNISMPRKLPNNVVVQGSSLNNRTILPPGITVKRTLISNNMSNLNVKRKRPPTVVQLSKSGIVTTSNEVLTVDLDDDEPATSSTAGPQWYLRPEEQGKTDNPQEKAPCKLTDPLADNPQEITKDTSEIDQENTLKKSPKELRKMSPNKVPEKSPVVPDPSDLEKQNNKEPDKTRFIEITIDDSPIKPAPLQKGFKVGAELAIIIEDSPAKSTTDKTVPNCGSDDEKPVSPKERHSKKRLDYPKNIKLIETVEIEFEPLPVEKPTISTEEQDKEKKEELIQKVNSKKIVEVIDIVEIEESPIKPPETEQNTTPKKTKVATERQIKDRPEYKIMNVIETVDLDDKERDEFHPVYQSFINLCFHLENSDDMRKIVEKKIKSYYRQVPKEYTASEDFIDMVSSKIVAMKAAPEKMYLYIKDVVDELNLQRKVAKAQPVLKETKNEEQEKFLYGEESEFDLKRQRQIRKLEKTLKKLHRAIQKLEEQEVDFDDEEDSVYLLTESEDDTSSKEVKPLNKEALLQRYKERMVRVHAKLCQLTNTKMPSEARVQIDARPGQPKGPAKRLEKWINRKVPIGTPLPFPDFHDVLRCVRDANQEDRLGWNEADVMEEARDLFTRCGKKLQRRRQENEWRLAASRIPVDKVDPAEDSPDLKRKLEENKRLAAKKETDVFNKYVDRQNLLKLEAVEIGDKEAEESPVESDDDEPSEDAVTLISKEKRKECLKKLIQGKSKKANDDKENQPDDRSAESEHPQNENATIKDLNEAGSSKKEADVQGDVEHKDKEHPNPDTLNTTPLNADLPDRGNKDADKSDSGAKSKDENKEHSEKVHSLSDESNEIESDVDELHLLQKLYSENECNTSVQDSSDSGTPIAISDTSSINNVSSDERDKKKRSCDVISIENSSYSESEENKGDSSKDKEIENEIIDSLPTKKAIEETVSSNREIECTKDGVEKKSNKRNNDEYNQTVEDILLASSDEADDIELRKDDNPLKSPEVSVTETCVNLRDDSISIGETVIEENRKCTKDSGEESKSEYSDKNTNTDASSVEGMEIGPTEIYSEEQNGLVENIIDTMSVKSTDEGSVPEITSIKSPEPMDEETAAETTSIKSVETNEDGAIIETTSVKSVETINSENAKVATSVKSVETNDGKSNETTCVKAVECIEGGNANKTASVQSVETNKDDTINIGDLTKNEMKIAMDSTENTDAGDRNKPVAETKENNDSISEPMEVNSSV